MFPVNKRSKFLWSDVGLEGTMNRWLVESGIPPRTSCASCAIRADSITGTRQIPLICSESEAMTIDLRLYSSFRRLLAVDTAL